MTFGPGVKSSETRRQWTLPSKTLPGDMTGRGGGSLHFRARCRRLGVRGRWGGQAALAALQGHFPMSERTVTAPRSMPHARVLELCPAWLRGAASTAVVDC